MSSFIRPIEVVNGGYVRVGPTDTRFDPQLLSPFVDNAERKYVRDAIGATFFETIKGLRNVNDINYNSFLGPVEIGFPADADLESLFLDGKLFDLMGFAVLHESLPNIHFKITSMGVQVDQASYATPAGPNDMRYLADRYKENIRFLTEEVQNYLCDNADLYTPYGFDKTLFCKNCTVNKFSKPSTAPIFY